MKNERIEEIMEEIREREEAMREERRENEEIIARIFGFTSATAGIEVE